MSAVRRDLYFRRPSRCTRYLAVLALSPLLLLPSVSLAAPITVPTSLLPGAQYRLAFVTEGVRNALSTSIADYDAFVTAEANTEAALSSITWQVIGSTATVSARDHTSTAPDDFPGVPIFLLNDVKLVDDYADLWDGTIDVPFAVDQHGGNVVAPVEVWTGTMRDGRSWAVQSSVLFLGATMETTACSIVTFGPPQPKQGCVVVGFSAGTAGDWVDVFYRVPGGMLGLYAISNILTVPEPNHTAMLSLGFAALLVVRRVRLS